MAHEFKLKRRVEFSDTDMAGIAHFSNFFRWMEATEHAFFRSLGFTLHENDRDGMRGWARVHADCDYKRPLRYPDEFEVRLLVRGVHESSIEYSFAFVQAESEVARGSLEVVYVARPAGAESMRRAPIPPAIAAAVEVAPSELLQTRGG
jgi:YbgC/YbaW family acyl-CoA thioester hydrolase